MQDSSKISVSRATATIRWDKMTLLCCLQWHFIILLSLAITKNFFMDFIIIIPDIEILQFPVSSCKYGTGWNGRDQTRFLLGPSFKMPPTCAVPVAKAVAVIKQFIDYFRTHKLPGSSDPVWKLMSQALADLQLTWKPTCVYTNVTKNRRNILTIAREEMGVKLEPLMPKKDLFSDSEHSEPSISDDFDSENECFGKNESIKRLVLTEEEWNAIKPLGVDGDLQLRPKVWTNVVASAFWLQYRMPCAFVFKRSRVRYSLLTESYQIKFYGVCKSSDCKNIIKGRGEKKSDVAGVTCEIETKDTRHEKHAIVKRPFNGKRRLEAVQNLKCQGSAKYRKTEAQKLMGPGDNEPPILPRLNVLHGAKQEGINKELGIEKNDARDIVKSIEDMALSPRYSGTIHEVRGFPFRVIYGSVTQYHVYQEYRRMTKNRVKICIDATGGLVTKLRRSNGTKSAYIFLYAIVINIDGMTACIYQMLSERHTVGNIMAMLKEWIENGAKIPKEIVCDYSRALLMAISIIFNNQTIKAYINDRFKAFIEGTFAEPAAFIRIDVAHFTPMICRFPCFQNLRQLAIKDFFVRCVSLMLEATKLVDFQQILLLTCVVAQHTHDDSKIALEKLDTPNSARKQLEEWIATRNIVINYEVFETETKHDTPFDQAFAGSEENNNNEPELNFASESDIGKWIDAQIIKANELLEIGQNLNPFYLPDFIKRFTPVAKEFPIWSSVGMPPNTKRASSSHVEGYFNDLKNRTLKNYKLPISVNKFIKEHIKDIEETNCLVSGRIVQYNNELLHKNNDNFNCVSSELPSEEAYDPDFMEIENWRNKATAPDFERKPMISDEKANAEETAIGLETEIPFEERIDHEANVGKEETANRLEEKISFDEQIDHEANAGREETSIGIEEICIEERIDHSYSKRADDSVKKRSWNDSTFEISVSHVVASSTPIKDVISQQKIKPSAVTKYYKPYPDVRQENALVDENNINPKKINLLPNGSRCPAVRWNNCSYVIRNTCAFDSVIQILATAGTDNIEYFKFMETSSNQTLKFVSEFIKKGASKCILIERAKILFSFSKANVEKVTEKKVSLFNVDSECNVTRMVQALLVSCPSKIEINNCPKCGPKTIEYCTISPNHNILCRKGISALQEALQFYSKLYNISCCDGAGQYTRESSLKEHILIELDIRDNQNIQKAMQCSLGQIPQTMTFSDSNHQTSSEYRLAGVIELRPGHYIAHSLRNGGYWNTFNDMSKKPFSSYPATVIEPHLAIYIKKH